MATKTIIITGANTGLGFECAKSIALESTDWHIVIACRNTSKGTEAAREIQRVAKLTAKEVAITVMPLDLASSASIYHFVSLYSQKDSQQELPPLHGLVCNAGLQVVQGIQYTQEGFELTFGVNHLGHFLLTNLLLDKLQEASRIVVVSSGTHNPDVIEGRSYPAKYMKAELLANPLQSPQMSGMQRYTTSKLCNLLFGYELRRRLQKAQRAIAVHCFDPDGVPQTELLRGELPMSLHMMRRFMKREWVRTIFNRMGVAISTPEISGRAMARLILDPALEGHSGKYVQIVTERTSSKESYDEKKATELWRDSMNLVGLQATI
jgi:light-dependent protochlorophyllide reductase